MLTGLVFFLNSSWFSSTWLYDPFCSIEGFNNLTWKKLKSTDLENSHKRHSNKCKSPLWKYRLLDSLWFCKLRPYKSLHWVNIIMIKITWSLLATSWSWYIERKVKKKILLSRLTRHWAITNFSWLENPKFVNYVWVSVVIFHRRVKINLSFSFPSYRVFQELQEWSVDLVHVKRFWKSVNHSKKESTGYC